MLMNPDFWNHIKFIINPNIEIKFQGIQIFRHHIFEILDGRGIFYFLNQMACKGHYYRRDPRAHIPNKIAQKGVILISKIMLINICPKNVSF